MKKICEWCGKEFEAKVGNQKFCKDTHYSNCVICGKQFIVPNDMLNSKERKQTCSRKCSIQLRKNTNNVKYGGNAPSCSKKIADKIKSTNQERYGVDAPAQNKEIFDKIKKTNLERYGVEYGSQTKHAHEHYTQTMMEKYGVENVFQSPELRGKIHDTLVERYGVDNAMKSEKVKEERRRSTLAKTGYQHHWEDPEIRRKSQKTLNENYGVDYPIQYPDIQKNMKQTIQSRYGVDNPMQCPAIKEKAEETTLSRYGYRSILSSPEMRKKIQQTMFERYGVLNYAESSDYTHHVMKDPSKFEEFVKFDNDPKSYITENYNYKPSLSELSKDLGVGVEAISLRVSRCNCKELVGYVYSTLELEVYQFLTTILDPNEIIQNTKQIIKPYELDIFIPKYNFAIECNPASTHNSTVDTWDSSKDPLPYTYHKMKTDLCEEKGIFLFHIFGYDWLWHKDVIQSMILNVLRKSSNKIYARQCVVKTVKSNDASSFLTANHRQGPAGSSVKLGLYYKDELVSLMTFSKMRNTIGTGSEDLSDCYELVRFCSKLNTSVVGGASKLFKHFILAYNPQRVRSFSDRAHTRGNLYSNLGFKEVRRSDPGYVWVNLYNDKPYHRYNAQKQNIREFLKDDSIDLSRTERDIMASHNFVQVFDSGTITWEWKSN